MSSLKLKQFMFPVSFLFISSFELMHIKMFIFFSKKNHFSPGAILSLRVLNDTDYTLFL